MHRRDFIKTTGLMASAAWLWDGGQFVLADEAARYPDDAFSRPAVDHIPCFETLAGISPAGSIHTRAALYRRTIHRSGPVERVEVGNRIELAPWEGGQATRWILEPIHIDNGWMRVPLWLRRAPEAIAVRVRVDGPSGTTLSADITELPWPALPELDAAAWQVGATQRLRPGVVEEVRFDLAEATLRPGQEVDREAPRWPANSLTLRLEGLTPGRHYEVLLAGLTVLYPTPGDLSVRELEVPGPLRAGREASVVVATNAVPRGRPVDLEFRQREHTLWRVRLAEAEVAALPRGVLADRPVPWYLPDGEYGVGLVVDGYRVAGAEARVRVEGATPRLPEASVRPHQGRPTFHLDGRPTTWHGYASYDYQPGNVSDFARHGANVFCMPVSTGGHVHNIGASPLTPDGEWDFTEIDEKVCQSLQDNPAGLLFPRVNLALPRQWAHAHPDEVCLVESEAGLLPWEEGDAYPAPSIASLVWLRDQEEALRRVIRYCLSRPWASRIAGFWITGEVTEEWFHWACNDKAYADYSAPAQARFGDWLRSRGVPVSDDAPIPDQATRDCGDWDVYPEDAPHRLAALYHRHLSELTSEVIGHFARVVKEESRGRSLVGTFHGYVIQLAGEPRQALAGHFDARRYLDDPNIDYVAGIPLHDFRMLTNGYNPYVIAYESVAAAGKLYVNENDLFSWLHPGPWHVHYDEEDPFGGAVAMHRRNLAADAVRGAMSQRFSLMSTWHRNDALQEEFQRHTAISRVALNVDRTPAVEVAFIVDDTSFAWAPPASTWLHGTNKLMLHAVGKAGAPVGVWLLSDLDRLPDGIRLVIVASAIAAKDEDLAKLSAMLRGGARSVVAVGPIGLVSPRTGEWRPEKPGQLLGLPIEVVDERLPVGVLDATTPVSSYPETARPRAQASSPGRFRYPDGMAASAERQLAAGGRLVWLGAPPLAPELWRQWIEAAGAHCYAPTGFFVHAARDIVSVTAPAAGRAVVRFPDEVEARDLFDGFEGRGYGIECPFEAGQTRLLRLRRK